MNEVGFVEAARVLAQRAIRDVDAKTPDARITRMFRLLVGRKPRPRELKILTAGFEAQLTEYEQQPDGTIRIPEALQPYMNGKTQIG